MTKLPPPPRYKCYKIVEAFEIIKIDTLRFNQALLTVKYPNSNIEHDFIVPESYILKHKPKVGGYWVRYEDNYESWSPKEAFESGYTLITNDVDEPQEPIVPLSSYLFLPFLETLLTTWRLKLTSHAKDIQDVADVNGAIYYLQLQLREFSSPPMIIGKEGKPRRI